ncbi:hypothetical protein [Sphingobacterium multivorum]|uniref:hypothetical protein n=1 Tax=Sphingobacterium multivorum TaxID=28454 RepID=UPI00345EB8C4
MTLQQTKEFMDGKSWESITVEIRPSNAKNEDGTLKPFYLKRVFTYQIDDTFELIVTNFADPYGKVALAEMYIKGTILWKGEHPIADGAFKADFSADIRYTVKPLLQPFADAMNQFTKGFDEWKVGEGQDILGKKFLPFGLKEGQIFKEYDLMYVFNDMLFWGARNIDGRGFDTEENRPTNLQIPLVKK